MALHPWETPRTSYTIQDGVTADDFNRIGNNISYIYQTTGPFGISSNNGNAYTVSIPDITSYEDRLMIKVYISATSTGSCTINLNNLGAKTVLKSNNDPTSKGDFRQGDIVSLLYYSNHFRIINSINSEVPYGTTTGNGTNYIASVTHVGALHPGTEITLKFHSANLGPSTLNVNGLGAHAIKIRTNEDTLQGYIQANQVSKLVFDGTYWQLQNTIATSLVNNIGQKNLIHIADTTNKVDATHYNLVVPLLTTLQNGMVINTTLSDIPNDNIFLNINNKGNKELILTDNLRLNSDFLHDKEIYFYYNSTKDKFILIPNGNIIESLNNKIESQNILTFNFKNKVAGSATENPSKIYWSLMHDTQSPDATKGSARSGWFEIGSDGNQDIIDRIKAIDNSLMTLNSDSNVANQKVQIMAELDLDPFCKTYFNGSHEALKNAMKRLDLNSWNNASGNNNGVTTHLSEQAMYNHNAKTWAMGSEKNRTNSIQKMHWFTTIAGEYLSNDNKLNVLIQSAYPSSLTISSILNVDYLEVKLTMKPSWELDENLRKSLQTNIDGNTANISSNLSKINSILHHSGSISDTGYIPLPNGCFLQWSTVSTDSDEQPQRTSGVTPTYFVNLTGTLPFTFPNKCLGAWGSVVNSAATWCNVFPKDNSNISIIMSGTTELIQYYRNNKIIYFAFGN